MDCLQVPRFPDLKPVGSKVEMAIARGNLSRSGDKLKQLPNTEPVGTRTYCRLPLSVELQIDHTGALLQFHGAFQPAETAD